MVAVQFQRMRDHPLQKATRLRNVNLHQNALHLELVFLEGDVHAAALLRSRRHDPALLVSTRRELK
jgi:hypothetical protein